MSPDKTNNNEPQPIFSMGNPPGQLELLQRALQKSKTDNHEKDKKIRECTTTISSLENSLTQEIARTDDLETDLDEKTTQIKDLRATMKRGEKEHALLQASHRAAEEQSTKDAQEIRDLRVLSKKQRGALDATQKEVRELDEGNEQLRGEMACAKELAAKEVAEMAYQRGFDDAHALVREASKIENPGPWGASLASSTGSRVTSARMSTGSRSGSGSAGQEYTSISSRSQTSSVPGLTLEQELADLTDDDLHDPEYALEPYQILADPRDAPPLGKSDLATETVFKSDDHQPQPLSSSPAVHEPDLSEGRRENPDGVRMMLMSTLAWLWWWWWWQILGAKRVLSMQVVVASILMTLGYMWWTDGAWQWQQANQSPWSVYHERCIALGSDNRWLIDIQAYSTIQA